MDLQGCMEHGRAAGLSSQCVLPKGAIGACKMLLREGTGLCFGLRLGVLGAKGADLSLRARGHVLCCVSSPPTLLMCVNIYSASSFCPAVTTDGRT